MRRTILCTILALCTLSFVTASVMAGPNEFDIAPSQCMSEAKWDERTESNEAYLLGSFLAPNPAVTIEMWSVPGDDSWMAVYHAPVNATYCILAYGPAYIWEGEPVAEPEPEIEGDPT